MFGVYASISSYKVSSEHVSGFMSERCRVTRTVFKEY